VRGYILLFISYIKFLCKNIHALLKYQQKSQGLLTFYVHYVVAFWRRFGISVLRPIRCTSRRYRRCRSIYNIASHFISFRFTRRYETRKLVPFTTAVRLEIEIDADGRVVLILDYRQRRPLTVKQYVWSGDKPSMDLILQQPRASSYLVASRNG